MVWKLVGFIGWSVQTDYPHIKWCHWLASKLTEEKLHQLVPTTFCTWLLVTLFVILTGAFHANSGCAQGYSVILGSYPPFLCGHRYLKWHCELQLHNISHLGCLSHSPTLLMSLTWTIFLVHTFVISELPGVRVMPGEGEPINLDFGFTGVPQTWRLVPAEGELCRFLRSPRDHWLVCAGLGLDSP